MKIPLDRNSAQAVYLQIRDRIRRLIESGALQPGDQLPSIRSLAESTRVNKLTVIEAYSVLEADGLVHARQGAGYFVSSPPIKCPQSISQFAPPQEIILSEQQEGWSFFNSYTVSVSARKHIGIIDFSLAFAVSELEDLQKIARRAMKKVGSTLFDYELPHGQLTLRQLPKQL